MVDMNAEPIEMNTLSTMNAAVDQPVDMPSLPIDLIYPIVILMIRLIATSSSLWHPTAILQPLNVLSRTHVPLATKVALLHMPHIDMNLATKCGDLHLLKLMHQWSKQPRGRPLKYDSSELLPLAMKFDTTHIVEWWLDESKLLLNWDLDEYDLMEAFCDPLEHMWLEWWKTRGWQNLGLEVDSNHTLAGIAVHASRNGRVDILDWILRNADTTWMASAGADAAVAAARNGHVHVLDWWFFHFQARIDWIQVISAAFSGGQVTVLEWCGNHHLVMEAWSQPRKHWASVFLTLFDSGHVAALEWCKSQPLVMEAWRQCLDECLREFHKSEILSMCYKVVSRGLGLDWLRAFDMLQFADGNRDVSQNACEKGQVELVKELHSRGYLLGSRNQLVRSSLQSGKLELLQWIHANVDPSIPDMPGWYFGCDPYDISQGCGTVGVDILDWLLANGFQFPAPGDNKRAKVFGSAAYYGRLDVLEWMFMNGFAKDMTMEDWSKPFQSASQAGHVHVLDWLTERIPPVTPASPIPTSMVWRRVWRAFSDGRVDVIDWWAHKSGWLKDVYDLNHGQPYLYACDSCFVQCDAPSKLATLKVWVNAGQPVDFAACIHAASINGRVDVLDWLLRSTRASEEDFVKAWSSDKYPDESTLSSVHARYGFDIDNHAMSLTWWRANLPRVAKMPYVLNNASFELFSPYNAIEHFGECVDLLDYRKQAGYSYELEDVYECIEKASEMGQCDVLEWFKVASGIPIVCPTSISEGDIEVTRRAKVWWARSGLIDEKAVVKLKVEQD
ncbi:hypothetical protein BCR44DRAFT_1438692 [Catenaria anguillulae PL171]|uniref:Ankyrin repeat-containing domain protein n=1 Tax=Catenaria anguillulae PL171 TaxID=765915 RepID=A0A1Y2HFH4_9FUNG|nr:hypothetical protein BCR44DRAFT_1438692 [Catenaria anguillulae PL171]